MLTGCGETKEGALSFRKPHSISGCTKETLKQCGVESSKLKMF